MGSDERGCFGPELSSKGYCLTRNWNYCIRHLYFKKNRINGLLLYILVFLCALEAPNDVDTDVLNAFDSMPSLSLMRRSRRNAPPPPPPLAKPAPTIEPNPFVLAGCLLPSKENIQPAKEKDIEINYDSVSTVCPPLLHKTLQPKTLSVFEAGWLLSEASGRQVSLLLFTFTTNFTEQ